MSLGLKMVEGLVLGVPTNRDHMTLMSNLLQFGSTCTTTTSTSAPSSTNGIMAAKLAQDKLNHLFGWSGCSNPQIAWSINNQAWVDFIKCTSASTRQDFVTRYFCTPLQNKFHREMEFTKLHGFIKMMAELAFEPQLETVASKVSHGLSPLCFFDLERGALLSAMYYYNLNQEASVNTTSDIEKTKMGTPIIPWSPKELLAVLNRMMICLQFFFGNYCILLNQIKLVYTALVRVEHKYVHGYAFQNSLCKRICNGISKGCVWFFQQRKTAYDIQQNQFATVDLSSTIMAINLNMTNNETNFPIFLPDIPKPPPPQYQQQLQNPPLITNTNKRQQEQDTKRRTRTKQEHATHATTIPKFWTEIVNKYKEAQIRIPRTNDIRIKLNFESNAPFTKALGIDENDCMNYCIKGECWQKNCTRNHPANITLKESVIIPAYIITQRPKK